MADSQIRPGMSALAVGFPSIVRTNAYFRKHAPEVVEKAEQYALAKLWAKGDSVDAFDKPAIPYMDDPFRGTEERRVRAPGETSLTLEVKAARDVLAAANLTVHDIDLTLVTSFPADHFGAGNALYLAKELGLETPAWNYESACAGSVVGLHQAASMVRSGDYRRVMVVASTSNSICAQDKDSLGWFVGDGAGAFIVEPSRPGFGILGWKTLNAVETADMFVIHAVPAPEGGSRLLTSAAPWANACARETSAPYLKTCVQGALDMAEVKKDDIDFWVFNTPNAWYADYCGQVLEIPNDRYHTVYKHYGNIGSALMPATLYHALHDKRIKSGDLVCLYAIGSTSTSSSVVMRVDDIAIGAFPTRPENVDPPPHKPQTVPPEVATAT